jgi:release factor glutamine methyltransferase
MPVQVVAVEREAGAISWLERNIAKHDVDVRVIKSDVGTALIDVKCDLVVANPPYIPEGAELQREVASYEPSSALYGGIAGLEEPTRFIDTATRILKAGGMLLMEHHESQGEAIASILRSDFTEISNFLDLNDRPRWISVRKVN